MRFSLDESGPEQLLAHLRAADASFAPPLSSWLNLATYADKLAARARRIEAWEDGRLVGCIAMYADDAEGGAYISHVCVLPSHQGSGLGDRLLTRALALAQELAMPRVRLEVHTDNSAAMRLYRRHGFQPETDAASGATHFLQRVP